MAILSFENVGIRSIAACVPSKVEHNEELIKFLTRDEVEKTINTIGIRKRRYADNHVCASDLCYRAADKLLNNLNIDRDSIDILIFLSQTPDYKMPATAPLLQNRLKLSKNCGAFDINLACSGYIYGLSTAFAYASQPNINNVLLLVGDTMSKIIDQQDMVNVPLFGDAGTATLVNKGEYGKSHFSLYSDGSGHGLMEVMAGQCRVPTTKENLEFKKNVNGNNRFINKFFMDGVDVFNFTMSVVPKSIKTILRETNNKLEDIDFLIFHQANKFMTDFFSKRLKFPIDKVPYCLEHFGNTSSSSIPLTIVDRIDNYSIKNSKILLSGFGAGLSWGTAVLNMTNCDLIEIEEY